MADSVAAWRGGGRCTAENSALWTPRKWCASLASEPMPQADALPRKTFRTRVRALWKHSVFNPYYLDRLLLWNGVAAAAPALRGRMLDVGCGDRPYAPLLKNIESYWGIEHPGAVMNVESALRVSFKRLQGIVSAFADASEIPFVENSFDSVLCTEVLEHVPDPGIVLKEIRRVLRPGGAAVFTVPFVGELHQVPYDFWRFTPYGLKKLFQDNGLEIETIRSRGNFPIVAGIVTAHSIYRLGAREIRQDGSVSLHWWTKPFVWLGCAIVQLTARAIGALSRDEGFAMGYVVVARKPAKP